MNDKEILYILSEKNLYGFGMVFNPYGNFLYATSSEYAKLILTTCPQDYTIINPQERTVFSTEKEKSSIISISNYFSGIFMPGSPIVDTSFYSLLLFKSLKGYSFINKKILDYGCGDGQYAKFFPNSLYYGYDIILGKDVNNSLHGEKYDVVLCNFVLEHVADPFETLEIISDSLKKNGLAIISFPSLSLHSLIDRLIFRKKILLPFFHLRTFAIINDISCISIFTILKFLKKLKFNCIHVKGIHSIPGNKRRIIGMPLFNFLGDQTIIIASKNG